MQIGMSFFLKIYMLLFLYITQTKSFLTNHEEIELFADIQKLKEDLKECNKKYQSLIFNIIKNKTEYSISDFLTPCPYFHD